MTGVRGKTLVINLPGSTSGVRDNLSLVLPVLDHAVDLLLGNAEGDHLSDE